MRNNRHIRFGLAPKLIIPMLAAVIVVFTLLTLIYRMQLSSAYQSSFEEHISLTNQLVASQIDGDELLPYIESLTPDENYMSLRENLSRLKIISGAKYLYIMSDTGIDGYFTYIVTGAAPWDSPEEASIALGDKELKSVFPEGEDVLKTGTAMSQASFSQSDDYGTLYYAYSPILDSNGRTVAFVGTDMDASQVIANTNNSMSVALTVTILLLAVFFSAFLLTFGSVLMTPLRDLTRAADRLAEGEISSSLPPKMLASGDEIGQLARAFQSVNLSFGRLIRVATGLLSDASRGKLTSRADSEAHRGSFREMVDRLNDTMESIRFYIDSLPDSVFISGNGGEIIYRNAQFTSMFGNLHSTVREWLASTDACGDDGQPSDALAAFFELPPEGGESARLVLWMTLSGETRCFAVQRSPELKKAVNNTICIVSDITELMRAKDEAQAASIAKSDFLSRISHELRTPLNAIIGMTNIAMRPDQTPDKTAQSLGHIHTASDHLLDIVNDVLDMSRIESNRLELHISRFTVSELLEQAQSIIAPQAKAQDIRLELNVTEQFAFDLLGDLLRMKQVLINLLSNAIKFTGQGGLISLSVQTAERRDGEVVLRFEVKDNGIGMSEDFLTKLFTPFEQEEQYIKRRFQGTGLGLPITKRLVEMMGGAIEVSSELGKGSAFTIIVPFEIATGIEQKNQPLAREDADMSRGLSGKPLMGARILLVEDVEVNRIIIHELLDSTGLIIEDAEDGLQAVDKVKSSPEAYYDLILMDVQMPRMDGHVATRVIREMKREDAQRLPIIAMTANAFKEDVDEAIASGMNSHVAKPVDYALLLDTMRRFL